MTAIYPVCRDDGLLIDISDSAASSPLAFENEFSEEISNQIDVINAGGGERLHTLFTHRLGDEWLLFTTRS